MCQPPTQTLLVVLFFLYLGHDYVRIARSRICLCPTQSVSMPSSIEPTSLEFAIDPAALLHLPTSRACTAPSLATPSSISITIGSRNLKGIPPLRRCTKLMRSTSVVPTSSSNGFSQRQVDQAKNKNKKLTVKKLHGAAENTVKLQLRSPLPSTLKTHPQR